MDRFKLLPTRQEAASLKLVDQFCGDDHGPGLNPRAARELAAYVRRVQAAFEQTVIRLPAPEPRPASPAAVRAPRPPPLHVRAQLDAVPDRQQRALADPAAPAIAWADAPTGSAVSRFVWVDPVSGTPYAVEAIADHDGWYVEFGDYMLGGNAENRAHAKHMAHVALGLLIEQRVGLDQASDAWTDAQRAALVRL